MNKKLAVAVILLLPLFFLFSCSMFKSEKSPDQGETESNLNRKTELVKDEKRESMKDETVETLPSPKTDDRIKDIIKLTERKQPEALEKKEPFYARLITGEAGKEEMPISLNLDAAPIAQVVRAFSNFLKFDYLIDPQVTGTVSISVNNTKMSRRDVWEMFEQILWLCGSYCSPDGDILHILPFAKMPQERKILADHEPQANVEVVFLAIRNAASKDILEKIKGFTTPGSTAMDIPYQNAILLIESPANVAKIRSLVKLLDQKNKNNWPQAVIQCTNVSASRVKAELAATLPILGFPVSTDNAQSEPGSINIVSLDRLQVIIATAANEEALNELRKWATILDRTDVGEQEQVFVYKIVNSKADQLLSAVSVIFPVEGTALSAGADGTGGASSTSSSSTSSGGSSRGSGLGSSSSMSGALSGSSSSLGGGSRLGASGSTGGASRPSTSASTSTSTGGAASKGGGADDKGPASVFDVPVKVFADGVHNRMVIRTTPRTYAMMRAVLERLDTVAAQVLLQVLVSEVTLTDSTKYGLEFSAKRGSGNNESVFGTNFADLLPKANQEGFKYLITNKNNPDQKFAYIQALAGKGNLKVLSSPQILVTSHSQALIKVGDSVPIVTNQITDTGSVSPNNTTVLNSAIEYVDTGIILYVTPHVTEGGLITIELDQTVSEANKTTSSNIDSPTISERVLKTSLSIRDGGTVIVGGIIKERAETNNSSFPFISEINLVSKLFGTTTSKVERTEMVVLITGRIINEYSNLDDITARYKQALKAITDMDKQNIREEDAK